MKIIVIGATGRVGSNIVAKLAKHPEDEVYAGARHPKKFQLVTKSPHLPWTSVTKWTTLKKLFLKRTQLSSLPVLVAEIC
ncbi:hypothetical protein FAM21838_00530 [Lentilactobacillus parabuchneri]|uniref:hypothetical protein n=1 Tax=Lentilactobacillus parabuchneri TaxID=152331 RepID=UPI000A251B5C|nr:hypothetical protein [Lentilactobacillus parabuchneri]ORN13022.1 hypothetical protein FAM21838_00530 [Lentilactobacillus parabuchneri]